MPELKPISGDDVESARNSGKNKKATTLKIDIALLQALTDLASEEGGYGAKIRLFETSLRNGLLYRDLLKKRVDEYMRVNKPLRDEYIEKIEQSDERISYVDGSPILLSDYIATEFIIDAIDEKIDRIDEQMRAAAEKDADPKIYGMDKKTFNIWIQKGWREAFQVDGGRAKARRGIGRK